MRFLKRAIGSLKQVVHLRIEHRERNLKDAHSFDARERGRRSVSMRPLEEKDISRKGSKLGEWKNAVEQLVEKRIQEQMHDGKGSRKDAEKRLGKEIAAVSKEFQQGNVYYTVRYYFAEGKYYWSSTRRISKFDLRHRPSM